MRTQTLERPTARRRHRRPSAVRPVGSPSPRRRPSSPRHASPHRSDLIAWDYALLNLAFALGAVLSYGYDVAAWSPWRLVVGAVAVNGLWTAIAFAKQIYRWYERVPLHDELFHLLKVGAFHFAIVTIAYYNLDLIPRHTWFLWIIYGTFAGGITLQRALSRRFKRRPVAKFTYVIVGGKPHHVDRLLDGFNYAFEGRARPLGRFGHTPHQTIPTIGDYEDLHAFLMSTNAVDKVVFIYSALTAEQEAAIINLCRRRAIDIEVMPRETALFTRGYEVQRHGVTTVLTASEEPLSRLSSKFIKRAFDLVVSGLFLACVFPWVYLVVAALIKRESPGPVLFRQKRTGYRDEPFQMIKFRTMTVNDASDTRQASKGDARVTDIGGILRKLSIDELPQFINVWRGEMSVVGPRPHMLAHTDQYTRLIDAYEIRHQAKPGVTGWAQINGWRGPTEELYRMEKRVEHDVWYLDNWTIFLDVKCVVMTVVNAIRGEENAV